MNDTKDQTFLEKVKSGHPIQTRYGTPAKFIAHVPEAKEPHRLVVLCDGWLRAAQEDGRLDKSVESQYDIILAPKPKVKREGWVNVYKDKSTSSVQDTEARANFSRFPNRVACVHIEWEEDAP